MSGWERIVWSGLRGWRSIVVSLGVVLALAGCSRGDKAEPSRGAETTAGTVRLALEPAQWPLEAVVATNSIELQDRLEVTGDVAVTRASPGPVLSSNAELVLGPDARVTGSVKADTLVLQERSRVTGNAAYNQRSGPGTVGGTSSSPLALPLPISVPALPQISPGTQAVQVNSSQSQTLAAGAYGAVTLANGNGGVLTKLTLSGGLYQITALTLGTDSRVECSAACEIRVTGRVLVEARSFVGPANVPRLGAGNVQFLVKGSNASSDPNSLPAAAYVDNDAELKAYLLAPNGTTRFGQRGKFYGKVVAKDVLFSLDGDALGQQLPLITQQPASITVDQGQPASFSVAAVGQGLAYQWQRGTNNIVGATGQQYTIAAAAPGDNGATFRVVITNAAGSVTSNSATLTVRTCAATDTTCNGVDDDCDGQMDEDYAPSCVGSATRRCVNGAVQTTECSDGNACNGVETCSAGSCVAGTPLNVDDGNPCTTDSCVPATGVQHVPVAAGTPCPDGNVCNGGETCNGCGICVAGAPLAVDDGNPCTTDSCDPATGVGHVPVAAGTACPDGNACNGAETCNGSGTCEAGTAPPVDDGNPCTTDGCDPASGPQHVPVAAGTPCADGNACNGDETCNASGTCVAGTAPTVDDGNPCTTDSCDPATGVRHTPIDTDPSCQLAVAELWSVRTSPQAYRFGAIAPSAAGEVLAEDLDNVVSVSSSGEVTPLLPGPKTGRVMLADDGDSFTMLIDPGQWTAGGYQQFTATGALMVDVMLPNVGWALPVPGTDKVFVPDVEANNVSSRMTQARFVSAAGGEQHFALPPVRLARVTPTRLLYTTPSELIQMTHDGVETWRVPLALHLYKVSRNGERAIGVLDQIGSHIVHVSLASGAVSAAVTLAGALWNLAVAPAGRYSAASTQTAVYLFDHGQLVSRFDLPVAYTNSLDVSDQGMVVVGAQLSDHVTKLILLGPDAKSWSDTRGRDNDAYRPFVRFFPDGSAFAASERSGLVAFFLTGSP